MPILKTWRPEGGAPIKVWTNDIEVEAMEQLDETARLPFIHHHVAAMPDCHWGCGSTVGSVLATTGAIVPAAVGVDIGCGMVARRLNMTASQLPDNLFGMRHAIEFAVPHGRTDDGGKNDRGAWGETPPDVLDAWSVLDDDDRWNSIQANHPKAIGRSTDRHLGTLGTGNHFIEVCIDLEQNVWVMLHSGSRGIGNKIGSYFIERAKKEMERWFIHLPNKDLSYLPEGSQLFDDYLDAVSWAQDFALANRTVMMARTLHAIERNLGVDVGSLASGTEAVNCHHNYVAREHHYGRNVLVTRKGAVRARVGDLGIIPGSMGARSFIVRGLGNPESFCSCSHGAGRRMGRNAAKKIFSVEDLKAQTAGIECRKDADVIDEIPAAYKDIRVVMDNQSDLVEVVAELKQVLCVKG